MSVQIILHALTPEELCKQIEAIIEKKLTEIMKDSPARKNHFSYLSRKQIAETLQVSLPTLHEWTKQGILVSYNVLVGYFS
jgi:dTDP-4-dehydrorhamnose reductase